MLVDVSHVHFTSNLWELGGGGEWENLITFILQWLFTLFFILSLLNFRKSVFQKLYDLYIEECEKEPEVKVSILLLYYYGFWNVEGEKNVEEEGNVKELNLKQIFIFLWVS